MNHGDAKYIVQLEPGVWLAPWYGDPGRTLVEASARVYSTERGAKIAAGRAVRFRKFPKIKVIAL